MSDTTAPPLLVLTGPTAVGKTAAAIHLAESFQGEIVSADSRQIYRGMDIGTAKPTAAEQAAAPHHLLDICDPADDFSLATYVALANQAIADITARGRLPILTGGTPLYINAVTEGWQLPQVPPDPALRAALTARAEQEGVAALTAELQAVDPVAAARSAGNLRRIIRALEVHSHTGQPMSALEGKSPPPYVQLPLVLTLDRATLHARADARVDQMLAAGLVAEVQTLLDASYLPTLPAFSGIGYAEIIDYLHGTCTLAEARTSIITNTHRYIRHQETWLRRNREAVRVDVGQAAWTPSLQQLVTNWLGRQATGDTTKGVQ